MTPRRKKERRAKSEFWRQSSLEERTPALRPSQPIPCDAARTTAGRAASLHVLFRKAARQGTLPRILSRAPTSSTQLSGVTAPRGHSLSSLLNFRRGSSSNFVRATERCTLAGIRPDLHIAGIHVTARRARTAESRQFLPYRAPRSNKK